MKGVSALGLTGIVSSLAGCSGGQSRGEKVQELTFWSWPQDAKSQYTMSQLMRDGIEELGFEVDFRPVSRNRQIQKASVELDFDFVTFGYTGRPQRIDPMALAGRLYHKREMPEGYNNPRYNSEKVNELINEQKRTFDQDERAKNVKQLQTMLMNPPDEQPDVENFEDGPGPILPAIHDHLLNMYNNANWEGFVQVPGLGLKNWWTWTGVKPKTDDKQLLAIYPSELEFSLSPLNSSEANRIAQRLIHDKLARVGEDGLAKPSLAKDWEYADDGSSVTYNLREGQKFHDGEPLTAEDVAFTFNYMKEWETPFYASAVTSMKKDGATAVDDTTVKIEFSEPDATWDIVTAARITILPKHIWSNVPDNVSAAKPYEFSPTESEYGLIGSGPFQFENWRRGDQIQLSVNSDHWMAPEYDELVINIVQNPSTRQSMMRNGNADFLVDATAGNPDLLEQMANESDSLTFVQSPNVGFQELTMNYVRPPMDDPNVRAALACTIKKNIIKNEAFGGYADIAHSFIHPALEQWYNPDVFDYTSVGKEEGQKYLEEAGLIVADDGIYYPEGEVPPGSEKNKAYNQTDDS